MRLQNLKLLEASKPSDHEASLSAALDHLTKQCKPYIDLYKRTGYRFLRGISYDKHREHRSMQLPKFIVRTDRKPRDTSKISHKLFNLATQQFGNHPDWRSSSLFVTRNYDHAASYGVVCVIIPIGEFELLYSPSVADLYTEFDNVTHVFRIRDFLRSKYPRAVTELRRNPLFAAALGEYRAALVKIFNMLNSSTELEHKLEPKLIDEIINESYERYASTENESYSAFAHVACGMYRTGDIIRIEHGGKAGAYGIDVQFDFVPLFDFLDGKFEISARTKTFSARDRIAIRTQYAKIYRILEQALNDFIKKHSAEMAEWYVETISNVFKSVYTYYKKPSDIKRLNDTNEIMIRCKEYYMVETHVFDNLMHMILENEKGVVSDE